MRPTATWDDRRPLGLESTGDVEAPSFCPFCKSAAVSTTAKPSDRSTYWRCGGCGEIWNITRLKSTSPAPIRRNWYGR